MKRLPPMPFLIGLVLISGNFFPQNHCLADEVIHPETNDEATNFINPKISSASRLGTDVKSAPSIVTVITHDEILRSGARDMIDILMMVPGYFPATDTQSVVDFGSRGLWGHEGKINLAIDGREYNENGYGTNWFGNHFPVQLIERVEVIRGPASALYGGFAEIGYINIVTLSAKELNGIFVGTQLGATANSYSQRDISFAYGKVNGDFSYSISGFTGQGQRSDRTYTDRDGNTVSLNKQDVLDPLFFNVDVAWKDLEIKLIADRYHTTSLDWYGSNLSTPQNNDFTSYLGHIKYKVGITDQWSLTPEFRYRYMKTWENTLSTVANTDPNYFDYETTRVKYKLGSVYNFSSDLKWNIGVEAIEDTAKNNNQVQASQLQAGATSVSYWTLAGFTDLLYVHSLAEVTLGGRFDHNTFSGNNFSPRIAVVKPYEFWHWKLLYGKSYRAPVAFNIGSNDKIQAETTTAYEMEVGFEPNKNLSFNLNLFDLVIDTPITYTTNADGNSIYQNAEKIGSMGLEFETRYVEQWGETRLNYSYYKTDNNKAPSYSVPDNDKVYLAFPSHKVAIQSSVKLGSNDLRLTPQLIAYSERYAYVSDPNTPSKLPAAFQLNLNLRKKNFLVKGLNASVGVFNLTNTQIDFAQPYSSPNGDHPPLPTLTRDYVAQLSYELAI